MLCHPSWEDILTRHPRFGISRALYFKMQRLCGADMLILPGDFATDFMDEEEAQKCVAACMEPLGNIKPILPIIAGGKSPESLRQYVNAVGSTDFMIIAATAVDSHPQGIEAGARAFREAWLKIA